MQFIKEDQFSWADYDCSRNDLRIRNPTYNYNRRIFQDEKTGLYFFKMEYNRYIYVYIGFVESLDGLHEQSLLPSMHLDVDYDLKHARRKDGVDELTDEEFIEQAKQQLQLYLRRNQQTRAVKSRARAKARAALQAYHLAQGTIGVVSTGTIKLKEHGDETLIDYRMRVLLEDRDDHVNWYYATKTKLAELWDLTAAEEEELTEKE